MNEIQKQEAAPLVARVYDREQIDLIKDTVAKGATDTELRLFLYQCQRTGLDPLLKQIHAVKRWDSSSRREVMAIQVGIDGYRLIADRTGRYAGNEDAEFGPAIDDGGRPVPGWAKVTVYKIVAGEPRPFSAKVFWREYAGRKKDGSLNSFWRDKPCTMLSKVAEAHALRKAFPAELSGVYTREEMDQAGPEMVQAGPEADHSDPAARPAEASPPGGPPPTRPAQSPEDAMIGKIRTALQEAGVPEELWDEMIRKASHRVGSWGVDRLRSRTVTLAQVSACYGELRRQLNEVMSNREPEPGPADEQEPEVDPRGQEPEENPL